MPYSSDNRNPDGFANNNIQKWLTDFTRMSGEPFFAVIDVVFAIAFAGSWFRLYPSPDEAD